MIWSFHSECTQCPSVDSHGTVDGVRRTASLITEATKYLIWTPSSGLTAAFNILYILKKSQLRSWYRDWLWTGRPRGRNLNPGSAKKIHFSVLSRQALGFTQPPFQWVPGALSPGVKRQGSKATTHLKLLLKSRKCGCIHPLSHTSSLHSA
jgi:hypothetical protein